MTARRTYGWKPDIPDQRDIRYAAVYRVPKALPKRVDLQPLCTAVEDQGDLGSCTAHALTSALEVLEKKDGVPVVEMSRLFVYYNERRYEGSIASDDGAMLRTGIKTLVTEGACVEPKWPYIISKFKKKPAAACYTDGLKHQVTHYERIETLDQMRACLAEGFPFVFGFAVYESFETEAVATTGRAPMPRPRERMLGGHAVLAVGYDDRQKRFIVRNSWGTAWGKKGYFTLPYEYLASRDLSDDFWTIRKGELM